MEKLTALHYYTTVISLLVRNQMKANKFQVCLFNSQYSESHALCNFQDSRSSSSLSFSTAAPTLTFHWLCSAFRFLHKTTTSQVSLTHKSEKWTEKTALEICSRKRIWSTCNHKCISLKIPDITLAAFGESNSKNYDHRSVHFNYSSRNYPSS